MKDKDRIKELKRQLKQAKQHAYVHEIKTMYCADGELHLEYGNSKEWRWVVFNVEALFSDLPDIINQVVIEQKKMQEMTLEQIKISITE